VRVGNIAIKDKDFLGGRNVKKNNKNSGTCKIRP
jgi:hypothetical protein